MEKLGAGHGLGRVLGGHGGQPQAERRGLCGYLRASVRAPKGQHPQSAGGLLVQVLCSQIQPQTESQMQLGYDGCICSKHMLTSFPSSLFSNSTL